MKAQTKPASRPVGTIKQPEKATAKVHDPDRIVPVAKISAPHGVKGWIKLRTTDASPDVLEGTDRWYLGKKENGCWKMAKVLEAKMGGNKMLALVEGCDDRDKAEKLRGLYVGIRRGEFPELPDGVYYWYDLIGLDVIDGNGSLFGKVVALNSLPNDDILEVKGDAKTYLIPFRKPYLVKVELEAGRIVTSWKEDY